MGGRAAAIGTEAQSRKDGRMGNECSRETVKNLKRTMRIGTHDTENSKGQLRLGRLALRSQENLPQNRK